MSNTSMNTEYGFHRKTDGELQNLREFLNSTPGVGSDISSSSAIATGTTTTRTLAERFSDAINVKDYGAVGDGVTDDTSSFNLALSDLSGRNVKLIISEGDYVIDGTVNVPEDVILDFNGGTLTVNGNIIIDGTVNAERYRIFNYSGNVQDHIQGECKNKTLYPEWFGGFRSIKDTPVDVTQGINDCLRYAFESKVYDVELAGGSSQKFAAGSGFRYFATSIEIPARTYFHGTNRDTTTIEQIPGTNNLPLLTDWATTGAERVKIQYMTLNCRQNTGSSCIRLGFNPAFVWGVEGWIADVQCREFSDYGVIVRASVSHIYRLTCIEGVSGAIGLNLQGGSVHTYTYITNNVDTPLQFQGSGHKVYGYHAELTVSTVVAEWLSSTTECVIHGGVFLRNTTNPSDAIFKFETATRDNGFYDFVCQGNYTPTSPYIIDEQYKLESRGDMKTYIQGVERRPINVVTDSDLSGSGQFRIDNPMRSYTFVGTNTSAFFRLPSVSARNTGLEFSIFNTANFNINVQPNETDLGDSVFYGVANNVDIPPRTLMTFRYADDSPKIIAYDPYV